MGNLCQKDQNSSNNSSIYYEPRKGVCIKDTFIIGQCCRNSLLNPNVGRLIIKEEYEKEVDSPKPQESPLKNSPYTTITTQWGISDHPNKPNTQSSSQNLLTDCECQKDEI